MIGRLSKFAKSVISTFETLLADFGKQGCLPKHAVCVPCYRHGRLWCEIRLLFLQWKVLDLWWWITDRVIVEANVQGRGRTARTGKIVPRPGQWDDDLALWERLYERANQQPSKDTR